jgi:hypothetical protein
MSDVAIRVRGALDELGLGTDTVDELAGALLWRIGRAIDEGPVTVRVGFATSASLFADLPRLRNATEEELAAAIESDELRVEWVGPRAR